MARKKNTEDLPKNTIRSIAEPVTDKKKGRGINKSEEKASDNKIGFFSKTRKLLRDERTVKLTGLFLVLFSVVLLASFTSYFFSWKADQTIAEGGQFEVKPRNVMGILGVKLSHLFIHQWFGISAFYLIPVFLFTGIRLLYGKKLVKLSRATAILTFLTIWGSGTLAFIFPSVGEGILGGRFGANLNEMLIHAVGKLGTALVYLFSFLAFLVIAFNSSLRISWLYSKKKAVEISDDSPLDKTEVSTEAATKVNVYSHRNEILQDSETLEEAKSEEEDELDIPLDKIPEFEVKEITPESVKEEKNSPGLTGIEMDISIPTAKEPTLSDQIEFTLNDNPQSEEIAQGKETVTSDDLVKKYGEYDPRLDLPKYVFPSIDLLVDHGDQEIQINKDELEENKNRIVETLRNYSIDISKIKATVGPTVTLYEIVPAAGVRISKIKNLEDDIALSLAALGIRIIAPIPGKGTIGIEVPNQNPQVVSMLSVLRHEKFINTKFDLPIGLGKTISNEVYIADLAKMPHLLMAGATGQGKSVGLNAILVSLLYKKHPAEIKFVMVDPKKVELTLYNHIEKHYLAKLPGEEKAIITDTKKAQNTLNSLCIEMDNRYALLENAQVRTLREYNAKFVSRQLNPMDGHRYLPYIVVVIDEFADLIMTAGKEIEMPIARIAQLARAVGIHLIIATQRPSVNIITGTIKANFPARIAFRVTSKVDSRTILDSGGAEQLIGRGDMLLSTGSDLIRLQCPFVDTPEVEKIARFIGSQPGYPEAMKLPEYVGEEGDPDKTKLDIGERDELFEEAARIIVQHQQGSASLLQRRLNLGYNRAGRLIDQMEAAGIVGPNKGSKAREVLIPDEYALEQYLKDKL
ncbi:MAG: DNA translocase FtsK [Flavobacteriales bacterium]|nr:DNA translocase FtsK [Flavobacteriales bacterium]